MFFTLLLVLAVATAQYDPFSEIHHNCRQCLEADPSQNHGWCPTPDDPNFSILKRQLNGHCIVLQDESMCDVPLVKTADDCPTLPLGNTPQMGFNPWNAFHCDISEVLAKQTADLFVSLGLRDAGYNYINLDDCWQVDRDPDTQEIIADPKTFPNGIPALADYIHSKDMKMGIYSDAGEFTCQGRPGSLGFEVIDAQTYSDWGIDYLKYDNCFNDNISSKIRYPVMADALDRVERPIFYSLCNQGQEDPATWATAWGNSWRTTNDISDSYDRMLFCLDGTEPWTRLVGPGSFNDPDMLEIGNGGMTTTEYISHFSLWAALKSPLLIGTDIRNISQTDLDIYLNTEVIAINQDPLAISASLIKQTENKEQQVWAGPLSNGEAVVILFNRGGTETATMNVRWEEIGFDKDAKLQVRDLWLQEDVGRFRGVFAANVESHGVVMVRLSQL